jgi:hypothetical protein
VIRARHFPSSGWNALMRNVLYCIVRPVALVHRRDAKVSKSPVANLTTATQFPSPRRQSDGIGTSPIADHGSSAESARCSRPRKADDGRPSPVPYQISKL